MSTYNDDYSTCAGTHATVRCYPGELDPDDVTEILGIEPTETQRVGEPWTKHQDYKLNGWFLTTKGQLDSLDSRRHLDWLIDQIYPKKKVIGDLMSRDVQFDISCYWISASGHGGPTLSPHQMHRLAELGIDLWYDVYLGGD